MHPPRRCRRGLTLLALPLLVCLLFATGAAGSQAAPPAPGTQPFGVVPLPPEARRITGPLPQLAALSSSNSKMDSSLDQVSAAGKISGAAAVSLAEAGGLHVSGTRVQVKLVAQSGMAQAVTAAVKQAGGEVTGSANEDTWLQAWIPVDNLQAIALVPGVEYVSRPAEAVLDATTEGLAAMNGPVWQAAGYRGSGVKVAVVDGGFQGYTSLLGTDLPAAVTVKNFVDGETDAQVNGTSPHGTACAEIIHDIAPDATLYLVKIATDVDLQEAVNYLKAQNVKVISTSLGWYNVTPGDGTGFFANLVQSARNSGIVWITAAGNDREAHWGGAFNPDEYGYHVFNPSTGQNVNFFGPGDDYAYDIPAGYLVQVYLRWDSWSTVNQDYNLYLLRWNDSLPGWQIFASSTNSQNGGAGQRPTEAIVAVTSGTATVYGILVERVSANRGANLELFAPKLDRLDELVHQRSLANLADSPAAVTVAALDVNAPYPQESYSSEGPANGPGGTASGGRIKPDISGFANVTTASYGTGGFNGTSSATPHVAGAAALLVGAYPTFSPASIQNFLQGLSKDMGAKGTDTVYGAGRVLLGATPNLLHPKIYLPSVTRRQ